MIDNSYLAFVGMFCVLDAAWENDKKTSDLSSFLSAIDPFLFKGIGSADPANYIEFKKTYEDELGKQASARDSYSFVQRYLKGINRNIASLFSETANIEDWEKGLSELEPQLQERLSTSKTEQ